MNKFNLFGVVGKDVTSDQLSFFLDNSKGEDVEIVVNSKGGDVFDGMAIYQLLKDYEGKITINIAGLCASIATVISCAGDLIKMSGTSWFMIHNAWGGASGEASDFRKKADFLDRVKGQVLNVYAVKTGMKEDKLSNMMDQETWLDAQEAFTAGFIDSITGDAVQAVACFDPSNFKQIPVGALQFFNQNKNEGSNMTEEQEEKIAMSVVDRVKAMFTKEKKEAEEVSMSAKLEEANAKIEGFEVKEAEMSAQAEELKANSSKIINALCEGKISKAEAEEFQALNSVDLDAKLEDAKPKFDGEALEGKDITPKLSILEQYHALDGSARSAFYAENKSAINLELKTKQNK